MSIPAGRVAQVAAEESAATIDGFGGVQERAHRGRGRGTAKDAGPAPSLAGTSRRPGRHGAFGSMMPYGGNNTAFRTRPGRCSGGLCASGTCGLRIRRHPRRRRPARRSVCSGAVPPGRSARVRRSQGGRHRRTALSSRTAFENSGSGWHSLAVQSPEVGSKRIKSHWALPSSFTMARA